MDGWLRRVACCLLLLGLLCIHAVAEKENIVKLTKFNFDNNVRRGTWFVKFFAPWCTHCQRLAPIWEKLADRAVDHEWPVKVAEVDCTVSKEVCEKVQIKAFPTLALISDGKLKGNFKGEVVSVTQFEEWLNAQNVLAADGVDVTSPPEKDSRQQATATHSMAVVATVKNAVARFPTTSHILNLYFYSGLSLALLVVILYACFSFADEQDQNAEEHEKDN